MSVHKTPSGSGTVASYINSKQVVNVTYKYTMENGNIWYKLGANQYVYGYYLKPHSSCSWNSGTTTKAATCTATGTKTQTCTLCGATRIVSISALGHNYSNGVCTRCSSWTVKSTTSISSVKYVIIKDEAKVHSAPYGSYSTTTILSKGTITLDVTSAKINKSASKILKATVKGASTKVTWSSSDKTIAKVSSSGVVTGVNKGSCTITATANDAKETCKINVVINLVGGFEQAHTISNYLSINKDYESDFFGGKAIALDGRNGNPDLCIPGLKNDDNFTPQDIAYYKQKNWYLISAYDPTKTSSSVIYTLDGTTGDFAALFTLYNSKEKKCTSHVGGIAVSENNIYVANDKNISYVSLSALNVSNGTCKKIIFSDSKNFSSKMNGAATSYAFSLVRYLLYIKVLKQ